MGTIARLNAVTYVIKLWSLEATHLQLGNLIIVLLWLKMRRAHLHLHLWSCFNRFVEILELCVSSAGGGGLHSATPHLSST